MSPNSDSGIVLLPILVLLVRPKLLGSAVQHGVHEFMAVGGAEALCERNGLVNGDPEGDLGLRGELEQANQKNCVLNRVQKLRLSVHPDRELGIERLTPAPNPLHQLAEILAVRLRHVLSVAELENQVLPRAVIELPAIQCLEGELAG